MKTLETIIDTYSGAHPRNGGEWRTWKELDASMKKDIQDYATECCKATLEKAKDKAVTDQSCQVWNCQGMSVNKESITSPENIVLL